MGPLATANAVPWRADVVTLVPAFWAHALGPGCGLAAEAFVHGIARLEVVALRDYGVGRHQKVDDTPYGGGAGMLLQAPPLLAAAAAARQRLARPVWLLDPAGEPLVQAHAAELAGGPGVILLCGRYEGVDARVLPACERRIAVGGAVLCGGDSAALVVLEAAVRLLPGVIGNRASLLEESFAGPDGHLEYPQYTRPAEVDGQGVPAVLRSGDHAAILAWRRARARPAGR